MSPILGSVGAMSHDAYRGNLDDYADDFFFQNKIIIFGISQKKNNPLIRN